MDEKNFFRTSDGAYLYFEDRGRGKPLVLVPGFMCTTRFFQKNVDYLSQKYRVIIFDPRGHGRSSKTGQRSNLEGYANDIRELLEYLDLQGVILFGWSMAGSVAVTYCQMFSCERLAALGLIDSALYPFGNGDWNRYGYRNYDVDNYLSMMQNWYLKPDIYYHRFSSKVFMEDCSPEEEQWIEEEIRKMPCWTGLEVHYDFCQTDCTAYLPNISVPTAIFCADSRLYPGGTAMGRYYKECMKAPTEVFEFFEGGHMLFYKEMERFHRCTEAFIQMYVK